MNRVAAVDDCAEQKTLRTALSSYFCGWDLERSELFLPSVGGFLFFSHAYATEPHLFREFLQSCGTALYIGYLPWFFDGNGQGGRGGQGAATGLSALRVEPDAGLEELRTAFTVDPGLADESPIQYYVRSGFILAPNPKWAIWFSTYWELAICGFAEAADADDFRLLHPELRFLTSDEVVSIYEPNPGSVAPSRLVHHLRHNLLNDDA